ncbi:MAG: 50S ribosomal protein L13 [bacterium]|nr:50S ribosomal protein L13 [bacterium]
MKSHIATPDEIKSTHKVHLIDANGVVLGRLASEAAKLLTGKHKPIYTPFLDTGDHVIIINADKVKLTGDKANKKPYRYHTLYPGGLKSQPYRIAMDEKPEKVLMKAIWGMLPKTRLGRKMLTKLRVYRGDRHPHAGQMPVSYTVASSRY